MNFIDSATEQTTACTDAILAIMAIAAAVYLQRIGHSQPWKTRLWVWAFSLLAIASMLGTIVHGFQLAAGLKAFLWQPLSLALGLLVALFMVAAVFDMWGQAVARRLLPVMIFVTAGFLLVTLFWADSFLVFIGYEAAVMLFALGIYTWLAYRRRLAGAWLMAAGILVTIAAAAIRAAAPLTFTVIWSFDHNGAFHLIQMAGLVLLVAGLDRGLRDCD